MEVVLGVIKMNADELSAPHKIIKTEEEEENVQVKLQTVMKEQKTLKMEDDVKVFSSSLIPKKKKNTLHF